MEDKLKLIFARLFSLDPASVTAESSPKTIKNWDSLAHINLVVSVEEEFGVQFSDDEIPKLTDFQTFVLAVRQKLG